MEEEYEEEECEVQDEEYDGFYKTDEEEDRAIYGQFVEPLIDVSHLPKAANSIEEL